jgi:transposase
MAAGYSLSAAAGYMGVHRDTIYHWARIDPEFSDALERGRALRVLHWERRMFSATDMTTVRLCIRMLRHDYRKELQMFPK